MSNLSNCAICEAEISAYLKNVPKNWRDEIVKAICKIKDEAASGVVCSDVKDCETTTNLSPFTVEGTEVSVTYTNEDNVNQIRTFDTGDLISSYFNALDPKCLTTQSNWDTLNVVQKLQLIIDGQCLCCNPPLCPVANNLVVGSGFTFDWDNTALATDSNVIGQRISFRPKDTLGAWHTAGFTPSNDINKTIHHAINPLIADNLIYQFKLETICGVGGPVISNNDIQEQITFQCVEPSYTYLIQGVPGFLETDITISLHNLDDVNSVDLLIRKVSDDSLFRGPYTMAVINGSLEQDISTNIDQSTYYYIQTRYRAFVQGVQVYSDSSNYLGAWCSSQSFIAPTSNTTTTTTTLPPGSTTTSTSTSSTTTTSTTTILCPAIAGMSASGTNGTTSTTTTTSTSTTTSTTSTTTTSTSTSTTTTTTTAFPGGYDTQLSFPSSNTDSDQGVTGTISAPNTTVTFSFNKVTPRSGFPETMEIKVGGVSIMIVDFYSDYSGDPFRFVDSLGTGYNGTFTNGIVNF